MVEFEGYSLRMGVEATGAIVVIASSTELIPNPLWGTPSAIGVQVGPGDDVVVIWTPDRPNHVKFPTLVVVN